MLTRGRMLDVLKQLGKEAVERIDEPLAREVGKETRANALLLASIRKLGDAYVVEMRALDPLHDEYIFTVSDRVTGKRRSSSSLTGSARPRRKPLAPRTPRRPRTQGGLHYHRQPQGMGTALPVPKGI